MIAPLANLLPVATDAVPLTIAPLATLLTSLLPALNPVALNADPAKDPVPADTKPCPN